MAQRTVDSIFQWMHGLSFGEAETDFTRDAPLGIPSGIPSSYWVYQATVTPPYFDLRCVIIAADGTCPRNGTVSADIMGMGAYFGPQNPNNRHWAVVGHGERVTNQRAELLAAIWALQRFHFLQTRAPGSEELSDGLHAVPEQVVIKTDSAYVVGCMTEWIFKWRNNGFVNARGFEVTSKCLLRHREHQEENGQCLT